MFRSAMLRTRARSCALLVRSVLLGNDAAGARRRAVYALVALLIGLSVSVANGFVAEFRAGGENPVPAMRWFEMGPASLMFSIAVAFGAFALMCIADRNQGQRSVGAPLPFSFRRVACMTAIVVAFWLPVLVIMYPGVLLHDTVVQIDQLFADNPITVYGALVEEGQPALSDHHPVASAFVFGFFVLVGDALFGSGYVGLYLYTLVQAMLMAFSYSVVVEYLRTKLEVPFWGWVAALGFFCMFPLFPLYAAAIVKDSLAAPFFVLFVIMYAEMVRTKGSICRNGRFVAALILVALLSVLFKKICLIVVVVALAMLALWLPRARRAAFASALTSCFVMMVAMPCVVFPLVGVVPGSSSEMFAVPFQQSALYAKLYDDASESEKAVLDDVLGYDTLASRYMPFSADTVKNFAPGIKGRVFDYLSTYLSQGVRHPMTYMRAHASLESGFVSTEDPLCAWYESVRYDDLDMTGVPSLYRDEPAFADAKLALEDGVEVLSCMPVVGILFAKGTYAFVLPLCLVAVSLALDRRRLFLVLPVLLFAAALYLSPVSMGYNGSRYVFALVCCAPLLLGVLLSGRNCGSVRQGAALGYSARGRVRARRAKTAKVGGRGR